MPSKEIVLRKIFYRKFQKILDNSSQLIYFLPQINKKERRRMNGQGLV